MSKQKWILAAAALGLIAVAAGYLARLHGHQRLGAPGVKTQPHAGTNYAVEVPLPERVLDYEAKPCEVGDVTLGYLPKDTCYGQSFYLAPDGFQLQLNAVLMGADRTSIHKPEFCLSGQGWHIDHQASAPDTVHVGGPTPYDLPVMKFIASKRVILNEQPVLTSGVYVFWFVADNEYTASHNQRMWWMARDMMRTGVLQRWAYVSCLGVCSPGQEDATFERMKKFLAAAVPEFQIPPRPAGTALAARP